MLHYWVNVPSIALIPKTIFLVTRKGDSNRVNSLGYYLHMVRGLGKKVKLEDN